MNMNISAILSIAVLAFVFIGYYALNYDFSGEGKEAPAFTPPYYFKSGEFVSYLNAFFFVFVFSLLFFGYSAPIALGIEGAKHASMLLQPNPVTFDLIFLVPQTLAAYSAIVLGQGVLEDIDGKSVFERWNRALKFFGIAFGMMIILIVVRVVLLS